MMNNNTPGAVFSSGSFLDNMTGEECRRLGDRYATQERNFDMMMKCYTKAVEKGNVDALLAIGNYHGNVLRNPEERNRYYMMAVEKGNTTAMIFMGHQYGNEQKYDEMNKYFSMAIERGGAEAMYLVGDYYRINRNYGEMEKYYMMATGRGNIRAMMAMGRFHISVHGNRAETKKYFKMAIETGRCDYTTISYIADLCKRYKDHDDAIKYNLIGVKEHSGKGINFSQLRYYLTREHFSTVIKHLIGLDMDIRMLIDNNLAVDDELVMLYDMIKKLMGIGNGHSNLRTMLSEMNRIVQAFR